MVKNWIFLNVNSYKYYNNLQYVIWFQFIPVFKVTETFFFSEIPKIEWKNICTPFNKLSIMDRPVY